MRKNFLKRLSDLRRFKYFRYVPQTKFSSPLFSFQPTFSNTTFITPYITPKRHYQRTSYHLTNMSEFEYLPPDFPNLTLAQKKQFITSFLQDNPELKSPLIVELQLYYTKYSETRKDQQEFNAILLHIIFSNKRVYLFWGIFAVLLFLAIKYFIRYRSKEIISFSEFINTYHKKTKHIIIHRNKIMLVLNDKKKVYLEQTPKEFERLYSGDIDIYYSPKNVMSSERIVISVLSVTVMGILIYYLFKSSMPQMDMEAFTGDILGKEIQKTENISKVLFKDVAGLNEQKKEIIEYVDFIKDFNKYNEIGCVLPRGCLLSGPPGTGKTLLAKAVAGECNVPFFSMSGSDFVEMIVGIGPQRVRSLFAEARENQPSIIFIDEIDAVGSQRGSGQFLGRNDERENTLNQLLIEMDGFKPNTNVIVMAATNRLSILDKALLRAGRFDRRIEIPLPDINEREEIFEIYLNRIKINQNEIKNYARRLAGLTPGLSGAEISNICNEAALLATRDSQEEIDIIYFEKAIDKIIGGLEKKNKKMTDFEKRVVSVHEAGHCIVGWLLEHTDPVVKVTIIPRSSGMLGFTQSLPRERTFSTSEQLEDHICLLLGGRVAESLVFNHLSTGAHNDLERSTKLAYTMVKEFGMSEEVGHVSFQHYDHILELQNPYSEKTEELIDKVCREIVQKQYDKVVSLLNENRDKLDSLTELLLEKETVDTKDIIECIGLPKNQSKEFDKYLESMTNYLL